MPCQVKKIGLAQILCRTLLPPFLRGGDNTRLRLGQKRVAGKHLIQGRERYQLAHKRALV